MRDDLPPDPDAWLARLDDVGPQQPAVIKGRLGRRRITFRDIRRIRVARDVRLEQQERRRKLVAMLYGGSESGARF